MPIAKIQLDDGRIARFEVPEGTTPDQVIEFARQNVPKPASGGRQGGLSDVMNETFTLGLNNEMAGAARMAAPVIQGARSIAETGARGIAERFGLPTSQIGSTPMPQPGAISDAYSSGRNDSVRRTQQAREASPVAAFGMDMVAGMANPLARLLPGSQAGAGMLANTARSAAGGALGGAAYGFNTAEGDLGDRGEGALTGGLVGGAVGAAAPALVEGASKGLRYLADQTIGRMGATNQSTVAARKIAEALQRDGMDPQAALARVQQLGPDAALLDVGPNSQALAAATARAPGRGKAALEGFVTARQEGVRNADNVLSGSQTQRVMSGIDGLIPDKFDATLAKAAAQRKAQGRNYNAANASGDLVDVAPMLKDLDDEIGRSKGGIKSALERVRSFVVDEGDRPEIAIDTLHQAKMAIDDLMSSGEGRNSIGKVGQAKIREFQDKLVSAIESSGQGGQAYNAGRTGTAAAWRTTEAAEAGTAFMNRAEFGNAKSIAASLAKMTPEDQEAFRMGAAQAIKSKLDNLNVRADATKKVMDIPALEDRIRAAFGDKDTFRRYIDMLNNERTMFDSYAAIKGNSKTAERMAADAALNGDPGGMAQDLVGLAANPLNPMNYVRAGVRYLGDAKARMGTPEPVRAQLAQMLSGRNTQALNQAMQSVEMNASDRARLARALMGGGAVAGGYTAP
jgi:hypothetical protein